MKIIATVGKYKDRETGLFVPIITFGEGEDQYSVLGPETEYDDAHRRVSEALGHFGAAAAALGLESTGEKT